MNLAALLTMAKMWTHSKGPSTMVSKMWFTHTEEYCSTLQRKEILSDPTTWANVGDITLSEISHYKNNNNG